MSRTAAGLGSFVGCCVLLLMGCYFIRTISYFNEVHNGVSLIARQLMQSHYTVNYDWKITNAEQLVSEVVLLSVESVNTASI